MFKITYLLAFVLVCATASGCASAVRGRTQEVKITTNPPGAQCRVADMSVITPAIVRLSRRGGYTVHCALTGYKPSMAMILSQLDYGPFGLFHLNFVFSVVDAKIGGLYKLQPDNVTMQMKSEIQDGQK